jgi:hypothetical protein
MYFRTMVDFQSYHHVHGRPSETAKLAAVTSWHSVDQYLKEEFVGVDVTPCRADAMAVTFHGNWNRSHCLELEQVIVGYPGMIENSCREVSQGQTVAQAAADMSMSSRIKYMHELKDAHLELL